MSLVDYSSNSDEDEEATAPAAASSASASSSSRAATAPPAKKVVKIVVDLPGARSDHRSNEDDDDSESAQQRKRLKLGASAAAAAAANAARPGGGRAGLSSLLPPPKVASGVLPKTLPAGKDEVKKAEPTATMLLPNSLRNKVAAVKAAPAAASVPAPASSNDDEESGEASHDAQDEDDDDDESAASIPARAPAKSSSVSFFSFPTAGPPKLPSASSSTLDFTPSIAAYAPPVTVSAYAPPAALAYSYDPSAYAAYAPSEYADVTAPYPTADTAYAEPAPEPVDIVPPEVRAMQSKHFRDRTVVFDEINQDDQVDISRIPMPELQQDSMFRPTEQIKGFKASGLQKGRHQITWLAQHALASERDIAERNARGMKSKRETQSKYGF